MIVDISSHSNPRIKYLKSLQKSRNRKKEGVFLMEGRPELDIALKTGLKPMQAIFCEEYISEAELKKHVDVANTPVMRVPKAIFDDLTYQNVPDNFLLLFKSWQLQLADFTPDLFTVVLENIEKPGNLGAILRTCDALGIKQLILANTDIDLYNPNVLRNSRGALFNVNVVSVSNEEALQFIQMNKKKIHAAALTEEAVSFKSAVIGKTDCVVFGAESTGLTDFWLENSDQQIIIPMLGVTDSLNISVSAAMILSQLVH